MMQHQTATGQGTMSSNGAVGCFATTKGEAFTSGEYEFTFTFSVETDDKGSTDLATVDIADAITGESYVSGKLQASDLKDGGWRSSLLHTDE